MRAEGETVGARIVEANGSVYKSVTSKYGGRPLVVVGVVGSRETRGT